MSWEDSTVSDGENRVTLGVDELAMTNSNILAALIELLEEKGVVRRDEVLARVAEMRGREKPI